MTTSHLTEKISAPGPVAPHRTAAALIAALTAVLADATGIETATADSDFFEDLGADSLLMARFCARVRKRADLPSISMRDVYTHRSVAALAAALAPPEPREPEFAQEAKLHPLPLTGAAPARSGTAAYLLCGALQLTIFLGYTLAVAVAATLAYHWLEEARTLAELYLRTVIVGTAAFGCFTALPILAKWVLIGRWTPRTIPLWSLAYVRFWVVKTLIRTNPLLLFAVGSPLLPLYLRALGSTIGPRVVILTRSLPVCPDLLSIGADTVIRKDAALPGYRARAGQLEIGGLSIGRDAFVGEAAVLDIHTVIGDGAQLGHASSLHSGQRIPDGAAWHGVPGQPSTASYRMSGQVRCGAARRIGYCVGQIVALLAVYLPAALISADALLFAFPGIRSFAATLVAPLGLIGFVGEALLISGALFFVGLRAIAIGRTGDPVAPRSRIGAAMKQSSSTWSRASSSRSTTSIIGTPDSARKWQCPGSQLSSKFEVPTSTHS